MKNMLVNLLISSNICLMVVCVLLTIRLVSRHDPLANGDIVEVKTPSFQHVGVVHGSSRRLVAGARDLVFCYQVVFPTNVVPSAYNGIWFPSKFVRKIQRPLNKNEVFK